MNVKTVTHSQQQPQHPKAHKKKSTIRLTYRTVFCVLQRSPLYRFLVLDEVKCKTHAQQHNSVEQSPETVNLTENDVQHTFQAPCCCFENALTKDLLLFEQSMCVLIVF